MANTRSRFGRDDGRVSLSDSEYDEMTIRMAKRRRTRGARIRTRALLWFIASLFVLVPAYVTLLAFVVRGNAEEVATRSDDLYNPAFPVRYEDLGEATITAWYDEGQPPLDLGPDVTWPTEIIGGDTYISPLGVPEDEDEESDTVPLRVTDLSLVGGSGDILHDDTYIESLEYHALVNGVPYNVALSIGTTSLDDPDAIPVLYAPPTITAATPVAVSSLTGMPGGDETELSDQALGLVDTWAEAWTHDSRSVIKQVTQDEATDSTYIGLPGGWQYVEDSVSVVWAVEEGQEGAIVRVEWEMQVPDTEMPDPEDPEQTVTVEGPTQLQTMDILLSGRESGLPAIVAWGPVGSGPDLEEFENAILDEDDVPSQDPSERRTSRTGSSSESSSDSFPGEESPSESASESSTAEPEEPTESATEGDD